MANPVLRGGLRLLSAFASSGLAERYGVEDQAKKLVTRAALLGVDLMQRGGKKARAPEDSGRPRQRFDLHPTESQELLRSTIRRFASEILRPAANDADVAMRPPDEVLSMAGEIGLTELAIPESFGGGAEERSPITAALLAEELGRGDMGLALALLSPMSVAHLVLDHGTEAQQRELLGRLGGDAFVPAAAALLEPRPLFDPRKLKTRAKRHGRGYRLDGDKALVPLGELAGFFLVSAELVGEGPRLFVVERDRPGVELTPEPSMGLRSANLCRMTLRGVELPADALLGDPAAHDHQRVIDLARVAWGALAVGQCQAVFDYVRPYCNERIAFGEPITNRQAVAFLIADMGIEIDGMRMLVWRAASRAEQGKRFTRNAHLLAVQASEKAMKIGTDGVQLLGGAGFIREHPVELWYRHLRAVGVMEGGLSA